MAEINAMPYGKPDYAQYVEYLESLGWRRSQLVLDEKNTRIVTTTGAGVGTSNGATTALIDIRCPAGQKISIMGNQQVPKGADSRTSHAVRMRLAGTNDVEISQFTKLRITKEKTTGDVVELARPFYADVSMVRTMSAAAVNSVQLKTDLEWYRFTQGIELNGEEHLFVYVVSETPTGGPNLPDIAIDATHVKFALSCDIFTS